MPRATMPKVLEAPTVISLDRVFVDQAERRFNEALHDVEHYRKQATELCYLAYEGMARGKFGTGAFNVSITCTDDEFIVSVKKEV